MWLQWAVVEQFCLGFWACLFHICTDELMSFSLDPYRNNNFWRHNNEEMWKEVNKMKDIINEFFMIDRIDFWFFAGKSL